MAQVTDPNRIQFDERIPFDAPAVPGVGSMQVEQPMWQRAATGIGMGMLDVGRSMWNELSSPEGIGQIGGALIGGGLGGMPGAILGAGIGRAGGAYLGGKEHPITAGLTGALTAATGEIGAPSTATLVARAGEGKVINSFIDTVNKYLPANAQISKDMVKLQETQLAKGDPNSLVSISNQNFQKSINSILDIPIGTGKFGNVVIHNTSLGDIKVSDMLSAIAEKRRPQGLADEMMKVDSKGVQQVTTPSRQRLLNEFEQFLNYHMTNKNTTPTMKAAAKLASGIYDTANNEMNKIRSVDRILRGTTSGEDITSRRGRLTLPEMQQEFTAALQGGSYGGLSAFDPNAIADMSQSLGRGTRLAGSTDIPGRVPPGSVHVGAGGAHPRFSIFGLELPSAVGGVGTKTKIAAKAAPSILQGFGREFQGE